MRIKSLDFLRALAVILVLFRHSDFENNVIQRFGWLGVDLFFVLSGFLVSGLLFTEYKTYNKVNIKRFLIRRGFKIYPAFYSFLIFSLFFDWFETGRTYLSSEILSEIFYLQSYLPHIWHHTWSLAVEEHFYIVLALLVLISIKLCVLQHTQKIIALLISLLLFSLIIRLIISLPHRTESFYFSQTHLRMDGILVGVLLSYLYHFTNHIFHLLKYGKLLGILGLLLVIPGFYFMGGSFFMNTLGLSLVNIGFGLILLIAITAEEKLNRLKHLFLKLPFRFVCFIGIHSYSVYLWHLWSKSIIIKLFSFDLFLMTLIYISFSIFVGILMSFSIERTFIRIRDKKWLLN